METTNMMKMFLALGGLQAKTMEEKVKYKERIIFATPGIIKPNNWEELSMEEKLRRLNKLETV